MLNIKKVYSRGDTEIETYLMKKIKKGNQEAFENLLIHYKEYLYKIAYSYVKNKESALDIIQESTYKAWMNIHTLKNKTVFKNWITKILINTAINYIKKESKIVSLDEDTPLVYKESGISIEEKIDLYKAIDLLKPKYKSVIILKYFNDMKIEEISDILDLPINTIKIQLKRDRESLSNILKEDYLSE